MNALTRIAGEYTLRIPRRLLSLIIVVALASRVTGLGFGLPLANARPDETIIAGWAVRFLAGDFRPEFFMYPTFMMDAVAVIYLAYYALGCPLTGCATLAAFLESRRQSLAPFLYLSRGFSAVMGTLTVWGVYEIGRRVFDETVGIVAALFLALSFLHVRDSHFGVTDVTMTALVVLAVLEIVRWHQTGDLRRAALAGLVGGLAMSAKYNGLGVALPFAVAVVQRAIDARPPRRAELGRNALAVLLFGAAFAVGFLGASPYIVIDWHRFASDIVTQKAMFTEGQGLAVTRGWWHHARQTLPIALGWPIYVAAVGGVAALLATQFRRSAVVLVFPLAYYVVAGSGYTVFARYMIPILPFLCITAAWLVVTAARALTRKRSSFVRHTAIAVAAIAMVAPSARAVVLIDRLLPRTDNRIIVARALEGLVSPGSSIYQSGEPYGVPIAPELAVHQWRYDEAAARFSSDGRLPDWIVLQRSPLLLYSRMPAGLERIVGEHYDRVAVFPVDRTRTDRTYDQQDAFFLPLEGFEGLERPGPGFEVYRLRGTPNSRS